MNHFSFCDNKNIKLKNPLISGGKTCLADPVAGLVNHGVLCSHVSYVH